MRKYFLLLISLMGLFLLLFVVARALNIPVLTDPEPFLSPGGFSSALVGVGLLIVDVLLPVPSSLVMVSHGALFGVPLGTLLSLAGRTGSFALGYSMGKKSIRLAGKFLDEKSILKADTLLGKWGYLAIVGSRPVPILSETVSIATGLSALPFGLSLLAAVLGSVPEALLFALTGAFANSFANTSIIFIAVILLTLLLWFIQRKRN